MSNVPKSLTSLLSFSSNPQNHRRALEKPFAAAILAAIVRSDSTSNEATLGATHFATLFPEAHGAAFPAAHIAAEQSLWPAELKANSTLGAAQRPTFRSPNGLHSRAHAPHGAADAAAQRSADVPALPTAHVAALAPAHRTPFVPTDAATQRAALPAAHANKLSILSPANCTLGAAHGPTQRTARGSPLGTAFAATDKPAQQATGERSKLRAHNAPHRQAVASPHAQTSDPASESGKCHELSHGSALCGALHRLQLHRLR